MRKQNKFEHGKLSIYQGLGDRPKELNKSILRSFIYKD